MPLRSLNQLLPLRRKIVGVRKWLIHRRMGVVLDPTVIISLSTRFASRKPGAIAIGRETLIAFKTLILSYDSRSGIDRPVTIGSRCFIGGGSMVLPGVTIGAGSVVAAGAVVAADVPPGCVVAGNPARIVTRDIKVGPYGNLRGPAGQHGNHD